MAETENSSPLEKILDSFRLAVETAREKGTYFEELIICYLKSKASYRDLYSKVLTYAQCAEQ
ncbi:MAG: hypothetical protein NC211_04130 [Alistipes senegalensis]|nr:hypothetical protein [Oxalobacter formigenes]MCM1281004.1 hypothetical protein [Alistipes senegalensis]